MAHLLGECGLHCGGDVRVVLCVRAWERVLVDDEVFEMDEAGLDLLRPIGSGSMVALLRRATFSRLLRESHVGSMQGDVSSCLTCAACFSGLGCVDVRIASWYSTCSLTTYLQQIYSEEGHGGLNY